MWLYPYFNIYNIIRPIFRYSNKVTPKYYILSQYFQNNVYTQTKLKYVSMECIKFTMVHYGQIFTYI